MFKKPHEFLVLEKEMVKGRKGRFLNRFLNPFRLIW
jgi:hypothetical protein